MKSVKNDYSSVDFKTFMFQISELHQLELIFNHKDEFNSGFLIAICLDLDIRQV